MAVEIFSSPKPTAQGGFVQRNIMSERYRVVLIDNPLVSPFPCEVWLSEEEAKAFCDSPEAREWRYRLRVQKDGPIEVQHGKPSTL